MTVEEFSYEFDVILNSQASLPLLGVGEIPTPVKIDEYEKSIFLTRAQEDIVKSLYAGNSTSKEAFESTEEMRRSLSELIVTYETSVTKSIGGVISNDSYLADIPERDMDDEIWFITYEAAIFDDERLGCLNGQYIAVVPVTQDAFYKTYRDPFKGPNKNRVLRLDVEGPQIELVSKYNIDTYIIRYVKKPAPIILIDLPDDLTINGKFDAMTCQLNTALHRPILDRAVLLALTSKLQYQSQSQTQSQEQSKQKNAEDK